MKCNMCESHVNNLVRKNIKIKKVSSSYKKNETIIFSLNFINKEDIISIFKDSGYKVLDYEINEVKMYLKEYEFCSKYFDEETINTIRSNETVALREINGTNPFEFLSIISNEFYSMKNMDSQFSIDADKQRINNLRKAKFINNRSETSFVITPA